MPKKLDRREFLKHGSAAGLGLALSSKALKSAGKNPVLSTAVPEDGHFRNKPMDRVRVGYVGIGNQGSGHLRNLLKIEGVDITAICDINAEHRTRAVKRITAAGKSEPKVYGEKGTEDYKRMCDENELDLVYNATPWEFHTPISTYAMQTGSHAASEIPGSITLDECWQTVEYAEKYQKHCITMENCNYDSFELMLLNMVRQEVFGELLHAECGYLHDLRGYKFGTVYFPHDWRLQHSIKRNADLYPCHGLGPVSQWMDITRGNKFEHLTSFSTQSRSLHLEAVKRYGPDHPLAKTKFALGDVVNTMLKTNRGQTILVTHDTNSPRPYSRKILLQGTKGLARKYPEGNIHIEGTSPAHRWETIPSGRNQKKDAAATYNQQYKHPLLSALEEKAQGAGHGGMDFIEDYRLIYCLRHGEPMDSDVYDGASMNSVVALSEKSIAENNASVECPDFTRGKWKVRHPVPIIDKV